MLLLQHLNQLTAGVGITETDLAENYSIYLADVDSVDYSTNLIGITVDFLSESFSDVLVVSHTDRDYMGYIEAEETPPLGEYFNHAAYTLVKEDQVFFFKHATDTTKNFALPYLDADGLDKWGNCPGTTYNRYLLVIMMFDKYNSGVDTDPQYYAFVWDVESGAEAQIVNGEDTGLIEFPCLLDELEEWYDTAIISSTIRNVTNSASQGQLRALVTDDGDSNDINDAYWEITTGSDTELTGTGTNYRVATGDYATGSGATVIQDYTRTYSDPYYYRAGTWTESISENASIIAASDPGGASDPWSDIFLGKCNSGSGGVDTGSKGVVKLEYGNEPEVAYTTSFYAARTIDVAGNFPTTELSIETSIGGISHTSYGVIYSNGSCVDIVKNVHELGNADNLPAHFIEGSYRDMSFYLLFSSVREIPGYHTSTSGETDIPMYRVYTGASWYPVIYPFVDTTMVVGEYDNFFTDDSGLRTALQSIITDYLDENSGYLYKYIIPGEIPSSGLPAWFGIPASMTRILIAPYDKRVIKYI